MGAMTRGLLVLVFIIVPVLLQAATEKTPEEKVRNGIQEITTILNDYCTEKENNRSACAKRVMKVADNYFDWREMAKRSLARFWRQRTKEEQKEFVRIFRHLLKDVYIDKIAGYSGEKIVFEGERTEGDYSEISTKVLADRGSNKAIPLNYRLHKKGNEWLVYDIVIEGVSLVSNYRSQFNSIIQRSTYDTLVKRMKEKIGEESR